MISELHVEQIGIFTNLTVDFEPGLTVITGETGAGKTLLVEAFGLLLGNRADGNVISDGAQQARVDGRFRNDTQETVLSRVVGEGRSRAYIDGRPSTLAQLAECSSTWVSLTSQGDVATAFSHAALRVALRAESPEVLHAEERVTAMWAEREQLLQLREGLSTDPREAEQLLDLYRYQLREFEQIGIEDPQEYERVEQEVEVLRNYETAQRGFMEALSALSHDGVTAVDIATSALAKAAAGHPLLERLQGLQAEMEDVIAELRILAEGIDDPAEQLQRAMQRQHDLKTLLRKYGESLEEVLAFRDALPIRIQELEERSERRSSIEAEISVATAALEEAADELRQQRKAAADRLSPRIVAHLQHLHMEHAQVDIRVTPATVGPHGADAISMWMSTNRGSSLKPLQSIASGGERSRVLLGLQLEVRPEVDTLIFDEIDAGIGGATGHAIGEHLATLARTHQVLCVTHLPQVAAFADHHLVIKKTDTPTGTIGTVTSLQSDSDRARELARMLAGVEDSAVAQQHAHELLQVAADRRSL